LSSVYRQDLNWLITGFTGRVADVAHAIVVSADGVPLAVSQRLPATYAGQLAAITSGLVSLMQGAARIFEAGLATQALVEMENGLLFVMAISDGSCLAVLAGRVDALLAEARQMNVSLDELVDLLRQRSQAFQPPSPEPHP